MPVDSGTSFIAERGPRYSTASSSSSARRARHWSRGTSTGVSPRNVNRAGEGTNTTLRIVVGVAGVIAGVIVIRHPQGALLALVLAVGVWLILSGLVDLMGAIVVTGEHRALRVLGGLADVVIGILILALPKISLTTLAVLIGIGFIIRGLVLIAGGWRLRGERSHSEPAPTPA